MDNRRILTIPRTNVSLKDLQYLAIKGGSYAPPIANEKLSDTLYVRTKGGAIKPIIKKIKKKVKKVKKKKAKAGIKSGDSCKSGQTEAKTNCNPDPVWARSIVSRRERASKNRNIKSPSYDYVINRKGKACKLGERPSHFNCTAYKYVKKGRKKKNNKKRYS